jgi:hypothetical protein
MPWDALDKSNASKLTSLIACGTVAARYLLITAHVAVLTTALPANLPRVGLRRREDGTHARLSSLTRSSNPIAKFADVTVESGV